MRENGVARDEEGAIMVVALFLATLLVGIAYTQKGVQTAVEVRERISDAADASAFSAASVYARSMNTVGLINQGQLVIAGVLQTLELAFQNAFNCPYPPTGLCTTYRNRFNAAYATAEQEMSPLLAAGRQASEEIRDGTPGFASRIAQEIAQRQLGSLEGVAVHVEKPLPLRMSNIQAWCGKNNMYLAGLLVSVAPGIPLSIFPKPGVWRVVDENFCTTYEDIGPMVMTPMVNQNGVEQEQVRIFILADNEPTDRARNRVRLEPQMIGQPLREESERPVQPERYGFAQAEYYSTWSGANEIYSDTPTQIPEENNYYMNWRARLRRFRPPASAGGSLTSWLSGEVYTHCMAARGADLETCNQLPGLAGLLPGAVH